MPLVWVELIDTFTFSPSELLPTTIVFEAFSTPCTRKTP